MPLKPSVPDPTESELIILQVLWARGPSSVRQVWAELGEKSGYTTVLKFLQIMLEKGLVHRDESAISHIYRAAMSEDQAKDRLMGGFMERVFRGSASELILRAVAAKPISDEELKSIRAVLAEKERKTQ